MSDVAAMANEEEHGEAAATAGAGEVGADGGIDVPLDSLPLAMSMELEQEVFPTALALAFSTRYRPSGGQHSDRGVPLPSQWRGAFPHTLPLPFRPIDASATGPPRADGADSSGEAMKLVPSIDAETVPVKSHDYFPEGLFETLLKACSQLGLDLQLTPQQQQQHPCVASPSSRSSPSPHAPLEHEEDVMTVALDEATDPSSLVCLSPLSSSRSSVNEGGAGEDSKDKEWCMATALSEGLSHYWQVLARVTYQDIHLQIPGASSPTEVYHFILLCYYCCHRDKIARILERTDVAHPSAVWFALGLCLGQNECRHLLYQLGRLPTPVSKSKNKAPTLWSQFHDGRARGATQRAGGGGHPSGWSANKPGDEEPVGVIEV
ncbi:unnamed protein product, partial [Vitrella brassicaformis CCMP3155]